MPNPREDLTGRRFGRLVVIGLAPYEDRPRWRCRCDCGNTHVVRASVLKAGKSRSCGCRAAAATTEARYADGC